MNVIRKPSFPTNIVFVSLITFSVSVCLDFLWGVSECFTEPVIDLGTIQRCQQSSLYLDSEDMYVTNVSDEVGLYSPAKIANTNIKVTAHHHIYRGVYICCEHCQSIYEIRSKI